MALNNLSRSTSLAPPAAATGLTWERAASQARRRALTRTVQALFREGLLDAPQLIREGTAAWLPLWRQQAMLRFESLTLGASGSCRLDGALVLYVSGQAPRLIGSPAALLSHLAPSIDADPSALARLQLELDNSVDNDTLCLSYRNEWSHELRRSAAGFGSLYAWLRSAPVPNPALLLEQWGTLGHPWHPCYKTKLGLTSDEVLALSPEFCAQLALPVAALRCDNAHVETAHARLDYRPWFAERFPTTWDTWQTALVRRGKDDASWLPLPTHPFQAEQVLPHDFAEEIAAGVLLLLPEVCLPATPTMSFRTVVPHGASDLPHIKLPVSLRLTSVQRTVSPKSAVMGPRLTALLRRIIHKEAGFDGMLDVLGEDIGIHYKLAPERDDHARHLSALFRANPMSRRGDGLFPYPVGALFADSPLDGRPLVSELIRLSGVAPLQFFEHYLRVALPAVLGPYLMYGIAFEAHQQNSFVLLDERGLPRRLLLRDFGDLRLHRPTLRERGLDVTPHREGHTVFDSAEPVRDKLLHAAFLCHLAELGLLIAHEHGLDESEVWSCFAREVERAFDRFSAQTDDMRWMSERQALLEADWPAKAFLRMRVADRSDDLQMRMRNPLRRA
jgi:siderophore synthetase component